MSFWERSKELLSKGALTSKEVFEKAKDKTKELGEKGVTRFEIAQLERQAENRFAMLGRLVYQVLIKEGQHTISKGTSEIKGLLTEVEKMEKEIDAKERELD